MVLESAQLSTCVGKHVGEDTDLARSEETLAVIIVESGSGTLGGIAFTSMVGADSVGGVGDSAPYTSPLSGLSSASEVALSSAGMDGTEKHEKICNGPTKLEIPMMTRCASAADPSSGCQPPKRGSPFVFVIMKAPSMKNSYKLFAFTVALTASIPAFAATNFTDADLTNSLISNSANWDNGLPVAAGDPLVANPGTLTVNAVANSTVLTGYDITHTDGTLSNSGTTLLALGTAAYTLDGASAKISGFRQISNTVGGVFTVESGAINLASGADSTFDGEFIVNGGTVSLSRRLSGKGIITINGGVLGSTSTGTENSIGGNNLLTGDYFMNGGDIDFRFLQVGNAGIDFFFGGTTAGNLTIENFGGFRHNPSFIDLDFATGTLMSLTLTNPVAFDDPTGDDRFGWANDNDGPAWAEALWSNGRLSYKNDTVSGVDILGEGGTTVLTWAQAQVDLGDGSFFVYNASTNTLSLGSGGTSAPEIAVEQPASTDLANGGSKDFGTVALGANTSLTFTIRNTGSDALNLNGTPAVTVSGTNAADFTVTAQPSASVSAGGGTTTFTVQFAPAAAGARSAVLSIANNDSNENPFTLNVGGTGQSESQTPYEAWAGGAAFDADANGDGVENGLAFLLGADTATSPVTLPTASLSSGSLVLTFNMRNAANRGSATLMVQHSSDLGIGDSWSAGATVPSNGGGVTFNVTPGSPLDSVVAEISASEAASGKLFGRLKAVPAP